MGPNYPATEGDGFHMAQNSAKIQKKLIIICTLSPKS